MINKRRNIKAITTSILLLCNPFFLYAQVNVTPSQTAAVLAQTLAGPGVTILNPTLNCPYAAAEGTFTVVSSNLGLDSGIVLTNGLAASGGGEYGVNGNPGNLASNPDGTPGDPQLSALVGGAATYDACALEFDVIPHGDSMQFDYVFGSEEYLQAVCSQYNDVFAFFVSGGTILTPENIALVPGTAIPVAINSINDGIPGKEAPKTNPYGYCKDMGPGSPFTAYYVDNSAGTTISYPGFTTVLTAACAVNPCDTYHLKIAIADVGDATYDSGVFLKAGSLHTTGFHIQSINVPLPDTTFSFCVKGCLPGRFIFSRSGAPPIAQTIKFKVSGTAVSGIDDSAIVNGVGYRTIPDSIVIAAGSSTATLNVIGIPTPLNGPKTIQLSLLSPYACTINEVIDSASLIIYDTMHVSITPHITVCGGDVTVLETVGENIYTYSWSPDVALSNPAIIDPTASPSSDITYTVMASLPGTTCPSKTAQITFTVNPTPNISMMSDTNICLHDSVTFNPLVTPASAFYTYLWKGPGGYSSSLLNPVINPTAGSSGIYMLSVINDTDNCSEIANINLTVTSPDTPAFNSPVIFCQNAAPVTLTAIGSNLLWYNSPGSNPDTAAPVPSTSDIAAYQYFVSQTINNCESPIVPIDVEIKKCCDGILYIPEAFTPNGDGKNDRFQLMKDYGYIVISFRVYNRWGQVVFDGKGDDSWDGSFEGKPVDMGVYFYDILIGCLNGGNIEKRGDVTVIR